MRKFLSLVLALVMMMSLVTINAGAKEFTDAEDITYGEAVDVISTIKVVDGYSDGSFHPGNNLTRGAAAKIICNMILGPTTAAELHADTAPYRDVPVTNDFSGYIAYCQKEGIISGYGDGSFRPAGTLTGYAFMKMLLGALGYDAEIEQYTGPNWSINVAKRAIGIGLNKGLDKTFNGVDYITREEACLYAFNTLQADLVEYSSKITANVNGAEVTVGNSNAVSREWNSQMSRVNNIREDNIIQFAEEYFNKLEKKHDQDDFERPAYTWIYDKEEIGTYVDWTLLVEEYTAGVTGRDLYDLLGATTLRDNPLTYYANGLVAGAGNPTAPSAQASTKGGNNIVVSDDIHRGNQETVGITGRGVLTQVFLDKDREELTITSISSFLSQASGDYNETREATPFTVYSYYELADLAMEVDVEDCPEVEKVKEDDWYLAKVTYKYSANGDVVELVKPEILEESTVTKFSATNKGVGQGLSGTDEWVTKLTTGGTEYKDNANAYYDPNILAEYEDNLLTDHTYNVYMDEYGYFIGVDEFEGTKNYVFITGFDRPTSNLSIKTADAAGIFLDGTMKTIKVDVSATNDNIDAINANQSGYGATTTKDQGAYFLKWDANLQVKASDDGMYALNRWFTYSEGKDGVYTLKPATRSTITRYAAGAEEKLRTDSLYVDDNIISLATGAEKPYDSLNAEAVPPATSGLYSKGSLTAYPSATNRVRVYGNDDSVFLTVDTDKVDTTTGYTAKNRAITDVNGVYTGVQNVQIEINSASRLEEAQVYTVYDSNNYIIGAVIDGEGDGGSGTVAYILDGPLSEKLEDGVYYWEFEAVVEGEIKTLTLKDTNRRSGSITALRNEADSTHKTIGKDIRGGDPVSLVASQGNWNVRDGLVELRFDADEYVTSIRSIAEDDIYSQYGNKWNNKADTDFAGSNSIVVEDTSSTTKTPYGTTAYTNVDIREMKAYRSGGINAYMVGAGQTWQDGEKLSDGTTNRLNHYDTAPNELTLVSRTLYVTNDQRDEGLALASDAKAVVVQWENGSWKTRAYSSVKSAIQNVAQPSGVFNGEVVAAVNNIGQATWVVITNYNELSSNYKPVETGGSVSSISVRYVDPDGTAVHNGTEFTGFILYGTKAGTTYQVTMNTYNASGVLINQRNMTVVGTGTKTVVPVAGTRNPTGFAGELDENTQIAIVCGDMVGTYVVPAVPINTAGWNAFIA